MKWVKFSERFPRESDFNSVSIDGCVLVRGKSDDLGFYCESERIQNIFEYYDRESSQEWLEGAFEVEVNK
jgi:hypothetical protein